MREDPRPDVLPDRRSREAHRGRAVRAALLGDGVQRDGAAEVALEAAHVPRSDIETILTIKHLLYEERFTIEGARKRLLELQRDARRGEVAPPKTGLAKLRDDLLQIRELASAL